mgnify:CR=1 FL=1
MLNLTPQEQNIVNYIDHHPKEVMTLNAKELSEKIFVSPPTMNRFIKKLGFSGYFDFSLPLFKNKIWQLKQNIKELQRIVM